MQMFSFSTTWDHCKVNLSFFFLHRFKLSGHSKFSTQYTCFVEVHLKISFNQGSKNLKVHLKKI